MNIEKLRVQEQTIICIGSYPAIVQSILDFDYLAGKKSPSIKAIIAGGKNFERYFFGSSEIIIPVFSSLSLVPNSLKQEITLFLNVVSSRRVLTTTLEMLESLPSLLGGVIFAENVPERHSIEIYNKAHASKKFVIGPSSVGLLIPNSIKLGAIGGVDYKQFFDSHIFTPGEIAVFSASGGMTNELIRIVAQNNKSVSFALSFGGDRFPIVTPKEAFLIAEQDPSTKTILYFGELGGDDEYKIVELLESKKITKEVICHIAGVVSTLFPTPPQFGHAKAMANTAHETAKAKREALQKAGAKVSNSFSEFVELVKKSKASNVQNENDYSTIAQSMQTRTKALITSTISKDYNGNPQILGEDLLSFAKTNSFAFTVASLFMGKKIKSKEMEEFTDFILRILVDHGPYVSGAMNTIVTARAGRDLVSSLASGLLTIGPRFGGAINQAASNWLTAVTTNESASEFVEEFAKKKEYISGIGHKKYRIDLPDPRVTEILKFTTKLKNKRFSDFAKEVELITTAKKGNLILNVDGAIACVMLDILSEKEELKDEDLKKLVQTEFFNAFFVLSRSVGFIAHFLDQKRLDEGLFRLEEHHVASLDNS